MNKQQRAADRNLLALFWRDIATTGFIEPRGERARRVIERWAAALDALDELDRRMRPLPCGHPIAAWRGDKTAGRCGWCEDIASAAGLPVSRVTLSVPDRFQDPAAVESVKSVADSDRDAGDGNGVTADERG